MDEPGIRFDELPRIYREQYLNAIELSRGEHDPCTEWKAFRETLWSYLERVFALNEAPGGGGNDGST